MSKSALDAIRTQVMWNRLIAVVEEQAQSLLRSAFGNSGHMWMYDLALMSRLLEEAGFADIRRCDFCDSGDPMFDKVEDRGRFYDSGERELAMQARKP